MKKKKPQLVFDGEKLKAVVITSEKLEGLQAEMTFIQKNGEVSLDHFNWIGDYAPTDDPDWIPQMLFGPALNQARAIFSDYHRRSKEHRKQKAPTSQARLPF